MPHIHYKTSIDKLDMFEDGSVDLIYSSHSLAYFDRIEVKALLQEWRRVLAGGGVLRLAVPDFDKLILAYQKSADLSTILGPLYGRMEIQTQEGERGEDGQIPKAHWSPSLAKSMSSALCKKPC